MGNSNSQIDFEYKILSKNYKPLQKIKDQCLGELIKMKNDKNGRIALVRERVLDLNDFRNQLETAMAYLSLRHANLGRFYGLAGSDTNPIQKTQNKPKLYVYFEYLPHSLRHDIDARKNQSKQSGSKSAGRFYTEPELFDILTQLVDVLEYLQQSNVSHGAIKPESVYLAKEGVVKVLNMKLLYPENSAFNNVKSGDQTHFLTPLAMKAIKAKKAEPLQDKYRSDVFSLGLLLLECATLKQSSQIYDWNNFTLNLSLFSNRLVEVKERYSLILYNILKEMLRIEEDQRPDFITLKETLVKEDKLNPMSDSFQLVTEEDCPPDQMFSPTMPYNMSYSKDKKSILQPRMSQDPTNFSSTNFSKIFQNQDNNEKNVVINEDSIETNREHKGPVRPAILSKTLEFKTPEQQRVFGLTSPKENHIFPKSFGFLNEKNTEMTQATPDENSRKKIFKQHNNENLNEVISPKSIRPLPINDAFKDKFSKLKGSTTSLQGSISFNALSEKDFNKNSSTKISESQTIPHRTKPVFNRNTKVDLTESSVDDAGFLSERTQQVLTFREQYEYEGQEKKSPFSVEKLLMEAVKRSQNFDCPSILNSRRNQQVHFQQDLMTSVLHQQQTECEYGVQVEQSNYKPTSYNSQPRASLELRLPISHPVIPSNAQDTVPEEEISTAKEKNTVRSTNRSRGILEVNTSSVNDINETNRVFVDNLIQPLRSISKSKKNENSAMKERNSAKKEKMPLQNRNNNLPHQRKPNIPRKFKESSQNSSSLNSIELHNNLNYPVQKNQENHNPQRELNTSLHETFQSFSSIQPKDASMTKYLTFPESKFNSENGSKIIQNLPDKSVEGDFVSQVEKALERSRLTVDLIKDISQSEVFEQIDWKFSARVPVGGITERLEKLLDNYEIPQ